MNSNYYAVIMAGGVGSRFWPVSTEQFPKQFHDMLGYGKTLLQKTYDRLGKFVQPSNILVLTNERYHALVKEQLPSIEEENIVMEPAMRNTAPCILYAAMKIQKRNSNAVMIVSPSDHWIEREDIFEKDIKKCFEKANENGVLITLGIVPTFANTGFGYIEYEKHEGDFKKVSKFTEKPNYQKAKEFLEAGNYLWNAGIFVWSAKSVLGAFKEYQPEMYGLFEAGISVYNGAGEHNFIENNYQKSENISVDYAIMEKSEKIYVYPAMFDWNDLGTWGSLYEKLDKDENANAVVNATVLLNEANGNVIRTERGKIVVIDSLKDYIIVDKDDVLLIYPKSKEQEIKAVSKEVEKMRQA